MTLRDIFASLLLVVAGWMSATYAQVSTNPSPIPTGYEGDVVITYDPTGGNGGMVGATACYVHTGVLTSASKNSGDWKYTKSQWRAANTPQLTATGDGKWALTIEGGIHAYYGVPESEQVTALCFVFHDGAGGSREGKTSSGGDIIVTLGEEGTGDIWDGFTPAAVTEQARPAGVSNGIYYGADGTSVTLCTYAASKTAPAQHVFVLGDFTDWTLDNAYQLKRDGNYFWITLTGLEAGKEYRYQYAVVRADGVKKQISDLYSEKVLHPDDKYEPSQVDANLLPYPTKGADGGYVTVIQPGRDAFEYEWQTTNFVRPNKNNLLIYELWIYDYTADRSIRGLMDKLDYIEDLGVNAIELMPVCEFDGNYNWGYSPNHYFALDKAYGTPRMFKELVDACHARGIAVILDLVFNHATGLNPMNKLYPYGSDLSSNPFFNAVAPHGDNVYEDWNHGFGPAHEMFIRALKYWQEEYRVDGFRMDLSHGFCSEQAGTSVANITDYYRQAIEPYGSYFILEHWGNNMGTERPQLVNLGCLCWESSQNNAFCQTAMGWLKDGDGYANGNRDGYVSYTCSHDEERPFYKAKKWGNGAIKTNETERLSRIAANQIMSILLDGSKMIWQYEEIGYDYSINSSENDPNGESNDNRCSKKPRPEKFGYFSPSGIRMAQYARIAQAAQLRTRLLPQVFEGNPTSVNIGSGVALRTIQWGSDVFVAANLGAEGNQTLTLPAGTWYDYLSGASIAQSTYSLAPGECKVFTGSPVAAPEIGKTEGICSYRTQKAAARKVLRNGKLLIIRDGKTYDLTGGRSGIFAEEGR